MPNNYATLTQLKAQLPDAIPSTEDAYDEALNELITRASRLIDQYKGRRDGAYSMDSDEETRIYNGPGGSMLWTDEMASAPSAVTVSQNGSRTDSDYVAYADTDYDLWPDNAAFERRPYTRIDLDTINGAYSSFYGYRRGVKVTAVFGYSLTANMPETVTQATIIQAARWWGRARQGFHDTGANPALGELTYTKELDPDVKLMLDILPAKVKI